MAITGRPRLDIELREILEAVRRCRTVMGAARELQCSAAYVHAKLREAGLSRAQVLDATNQKCFLKDRVD